ncbi:MAG: hypothetical protein JJ974_02000 [Phycisphaerales bacterium]|nr:hypothetical protein [Phycisphaerales bacterium]
MNLQSIIQMILGNPILIILLIGGGSSLLRAFKTMKEKQAQKRVRQQIIEQQRQAELDELRTGRRSASPQASPAPAVTQTQNDLASKKRQQELKRQRIEEIRQARIEQLKKIREKRSASQSANRAPNPSSQQSRRTPTAGSGRQSQPRPARPQPQRSAQPTARSTVQSAQQSATPYARKNPTPYAPVQSKKQSIQASQPERSRKIQNESIQQDQQSLVSPRRRRVTEDSNKIEVGAVPVAQRSIRKGVGKRIRSDLRYALIAKEVLGTPVGLRSQGDDGFGTL